MTETHLVNIDLAVCPACSDSLCPLYEDILYGIFQNDNGIKARNQNNPKSPKDYYRLIRCVILKKTYHIHFIIKLSKMF